MKGQAIVDYDENCVKLEMTLQDIAEPGLAIEAIKAASRALWPEIAFFGEAGFDDDAPASGGGDEAAPRAYRPRDLSKPPKPGSLDARVLEAARRLGTTDAVAIAADLDLDSRTAALRVGRLRKGGHL